MPVDGVAESEAPRGYARRNANVIIMRSDLSSPMSWGCSLNSAFGTALGSIFNIRRNGL